MILLSAKEWRIIIIDATSVRKTAATGFAIGSDAAAFTTGMLLSDCATALKNAESGE